MKRNPFLVRLFNETARRLEEERENVARLAPELFFRTPLSHWSTLANDPTLRTCGALEYLGKRFAEELDRDTGKANALAKLAVAIADSLPDNEYPAVILAQARAYAWKDLGKSRRSLGKIAESLDALTRAAHYLDPFSTCAYDHAVIRFNLAMSLQEADRFEESLGLIEESRSVFEEHGDADNALNCAIGKAVLLLRVKRHREACQTLFALLRVPAKPESRAVVHYVFALASIELERYGDAETHLREALSIYQDLKTPLHVLRTQVGLGRLLVRRGDIDDALVLLHDVRRDLTHHNLIEESGLAGLEIVDAYLRAGEALLAEATARAVLHEFADAGLNKRAIAALGYLTEAIAARKTTSIVPEIRDYIVSLRTNPERDLRLPSTTG